MEEIEALDRHAVEGGLEVRQMMELAGFHMVGVFDRENVAKENTVVIACGTGNKGGDGLSAARHLVNYGWKNISIVLSGEDIKPDAAHHLALVRKMEIPVVLYGKGTADAQNVFAKADVIVDALIGYHLSGAPRGAPEKIIRAINKSAARVIAYDLPSGVDASTGECEGECVNADATLTLAVPKQAFATENGKALAGTLYLADLGIPAAFYDRVIPASRPDFPKSGLALL